MDHEREVHAGQAVYTPATLRVYDLLVHGLSNRFLWRCPTHDLEALYDRNVSQRHIDVGVGTGYFLDHASWPSADPDILLVDLNPHSLAAAALRISRFAPEILTANVLQPLPDGPAYTSAGLCYLLHCLPGKIPEKAVVFDHLRPRLAAGARIFGATIVQGDAPRSRLAQALMDTYNRKGVFSNAQDTSADLEIELKKRFAKVSIEQRGCVVLFEGEAG